MAEQIAQPSTGRPMTTVEALDAAKTGEEFAAVLEGMFAQLSAARWPEDPVLADEDEL